MIIAGNEAEFVVAYLGVLHAGAVAVPVNVAAPAHELASEVDAVDPVLVLASRAHADLARRAIAHRSPVPPLVVVTDERADPASSPLIAREASDLAVLLFTAGTAGAPKPAMLTHGSLLANLDAMQAHHGLRIRRRRRRARRAAAVPCLRAQRRRGACTARRGQRRRWSIISIPRKRFLACSTTASRLSPRSPRSMTRGSRSTR